MTAGVLLVGASGLAREVVAAGMVGITGILDDDQRLHETEIDGVPVLGPVALAAERRDRLLVCIGPSAARRSVVRRLRAAGVDDARYETFVARSARIGSSSAIGAGTIVLDGVVITAHARVGRHVVIMPNAVITHDDTVADYATLAAGVALGGRVAIGEGAYLGMQSSVRPDVSIGADAVIGMGAAVLHQVPPGETWVGVPARRTEEKR
ncbi:NeuD/PglB/VioB family sugar acetyltransferase [Microbacterium sp. cx-59]|uniref:NeuD/PglB/VioB family sugar acetyltransferase n=1 Tax=Microbacterium sp. cx-59 TaxID=2891207 RepID=UPI001E295D79|nr:NeuD/PglB/VioB family sugar acetyltransferase [Microbacterium sp. cx-59]MCC4908033.1 NeuD/PglB/VioB family sugar acetyltransferase [Microbacterium sp. cx-59]